MSKSTSDALESKKSLKKLEMTLKNEIEGNKKLKKELVDTAEKNENNNIKLNAVMMEKTKLQSKQQIFY